jgi:hypothetical protein
MVEELGYNLSNMCTSTTGDFPMPKPGDPVVLLVFVDEAEIDAGALGKSLPMQVEAAMGSGVALFVSAKLTSSNEDAAPEDELNGVSATMEIPAHPSLLAKVMARCLIEARGTPLTFEEATTCVGLLTAEDSGPISMIRGGWTSLNSVNIFYPPRTPPDAKSLGRAAKALGAYDQRSRQDRTAVTPPEVVPDPDPAIDLPRKPLLPGWTPAKHALTWGGGATTLGFGVASIVTYSQGLSLNRDISSGVYGRAGDPRLDGAVERYNALGSRMPYLIVGTGIGAGAMTVGLLLPTKDTTTNLTVMAGPTGFAVAGRF